MTTPKLIALLGTPNHEIIRSIPAENQTCFLTGLKTALDKFNINNNDLLKALWLVACCCHKIGYEQALEDLKISETQG